MKAPRSTFGSTGALALIFGFLGVAATLSFGGSDDPVPVRSNSVIHPVIAPAELATIERTATTSDGLIADAAVAQAPAGDYLVLHTEFQTAEACQKFAVPGAFVFHRFERFADVFLTKREVIKDV